MTRARNRVYWSEERLWVDTVQKRPQNQRARVGYGIDLLSKQRFAEAEAQLRVAVSLDDRNAHAHMNLGSALSAQNKLGEGISHLQRALALDPDRKETYGLLGEAYSGTGQSELAVKYFLRAVELMPDNPFLLRRVAAELALSGDDRVRDVTKAVALAERAVQITNHQDFIALDTLAAAYAEQRRFAAAVGVERSAIAVAQAQHSESAVSQLSQRLQYQAGRSVRDAR
jgi:superkiller protein 3